MFVEPGRWPGWPEGLDRAKAAPLGTHQPPTEGLAVVRRTSVNNRNLCALFSPIVAAWTWFYI